MLICCATMLRKISKNQARRQHGQVLPSSVAIATLCLAIIALQPDKNSHKIRASHVP
jgi:hypothetical protein